MPQKCQIDDRFVAVGCVFSSSKYSKTRFRPDPAGNLGHPLHISFPSMPRGLGCQPPNTNSWLRLCELWRRLTYGGSLPNDDCSVCWVGWLPLITSLRLVEMKIYVVVKVYIHVKYWQSESEREAYGRSGGFREWPGLATVFEKTWSATQKNVKSHVFWILKKKRKKTYVDSQAT